MRELDFTALRASTAGVTSASGLSSTLRIVNIVATVSIGCLFVVAVPLILFGDVEAVFRVIPSLLFGSFNFAAVAAVVIAVILFAQYASDQQKKRITKIAAFAQANGLVFMQKAPPRGMKGMIFDQGRDGTITEALTFPDGVELGNYRYITGSGKNQTTHNFRYIRVALNKSLPNMVLDAKHNNFLGMTNLPDVYHSSQKLQLEGDFNEYFDLYAPEQYGRDALYVFTPDVMQSLIADGRKYDMEIVDNELYMYQPIFVNLSSEQDLKEVLKSVNVISSELRNQTKRYQDERALGSQPFVVAEQGRRLKRGVNWMVIGIVLVVFAFNGLVTFAPTEVSLPVMLISGALFWAFVIFAIVRSVSRRR